MDGYDKSMLRFHRRFKSTGQLLLQPDPGQWSFVQRYHGGAVHYG